jgi:hypothetical protein
VTWVAACRTHCSEGFYDPYFPEVCERWSSRHSMSTAKPQNPRAVGFTLSAAWEVIDSMIAPHLRLLADLINPSDVARMLC